MLHRGGDQVAPPFARRRERRAPDSQGRTLTASAGEDNLARVGCQDRRNLRARLVKRVSRGAALRVKRTWVTREILQHGNNRIAHYRVQWRGRRVVEVNPRDRHGRRDAPLAPD